MFCRCYSRRPLTAAATPLPAPRDLANATQLAQYKANNSVQGCFCAVGRDYFASAQANKDAVHFYAWHKVRQPGCAAAAAAPLPACAAEPLRPVPGPLQAGRTAVAVGKAMLRSHAPSTWRVSIGIHCQSSRSGGALSGTLGARSPTGTHGLLIGATSKRAAAHFSVLTAGASTRRGKHSSLQTPHTLFAHLAGRTLSCSAVLRRSASPRSPRRAAAATSPPATKKCAMTPASARATRSPCSMTR